MSLSRSLTTDPRTIAREMQGLSDMLFPQLSQGIVSNLNRRAIPLAQCQAVSSNLVDESPLQRAMLFEIAVVVAEQMIEGGKEVDWGHSVNVAVERQRAHFEATHPRALTDIEKEIALLVAENLVQMLLYIQSRHGGAKVVSAPRVPGYQWIASGVGDFSVGSALVEVKCTNKHFSSADYRQILMYWLLSYAAAIENGGDDWTQGILVNPRLNLVLELSFSDLVEVVGAGRSKVELVEAFSAMITDRMVQLSV